MGEDQGRAALVVADPTPTALLGNDRIDRRGSFVHFVGLPEVPTSKPYLRVQMAQSRETRLVTQHSEAVRLLRDRLARTARQHAIGAIEGAIRGDATTYAVHSGLALELALKARLVEHGAVYLADAISEWARDAAHLQRGEVTRRGNKGEQIAIRTVGGERANERLEQLEGPDRPWRSVDVTSILSLRNEAVHVGLGQAIELDELLRREAARFVRTLQQVTSLGGTYWGVTAGFVIALLSGAGDAASTRVNAAVHVAAQRWALYPSRQRAMEGVAAEIAEARTYGCMVATCRVCQNESVVIEGACTAQWHEIDEDDWDIDPVVEHESALCVVCHFSISGADELTVCELPLSHHPDPGSLDRKVRQQLGNGETVATTDRCPF